MTKKALFISVGTSTNSTGVNAVSPFSVDMASAQHLMKLLGYEIWVHDPYRAKYKTNHIVAAHGDKVIPHLELHKHINDFDIICLRFILHRYQNMVGVLNFGCNPREFETLDLMQKSGLPIYNFAVDYRKHLFPQTPESDWAVKSPDRCDWQSYDIYKDLVTSGQMKTVIGSPTHHSMLEGKSFIVPSNFVGYYPQVMETVGEPRPMGDWKYDVLIGGANKIPKGERLDTINRLVGHLENKGCVGRAKIKGWPDVTKGKYVDTNKYIEVMSQSKLQIVFAEPWLDWCSLRFWESMIYGGIFAIDASYEYGVKEAIELGLEDRILYGPEDVDALLACDASVLYSEQLLAFDRALNRKVPPVFTL